MSVAWHWVMGEGTWLGEGAERSSSVLRVYRRPREGDSELSGSGWMETAASGRELARTSTKQDQRERILPVKRVDVSKRSRSHLPRPKALLHTSPLCSIFPRAIELQVFLVYQSLDTYVYIFDCLLLRSSRHHCQRFQWMSMLFTSRGRVAHHTVSAEVQHKTQSVPHFSASSD